MPEPPATTDEATDVQLRRRLEGLSRILDVTRSLAAEIDLNKVLSTIINEACKALDCDRASLFQYDPQTDELYTSFVTELEISEIRKPVDTGISGYVARRRTMANIPDPAQDARWNSSIDQLTGYHTRNILAAPLSSPHDDSLLGVLQLLNKKDGEFDQTDEELLEAFSQHAAVALDRARLVEQLKEKQRVQASLNVAREIQQGFMPSRLPIIAGYDLATWWYPNEAVGGDYCDVVPLQDGRTALCIADVSGHGLGPALIMASVRAALRALVQEHTRAQILLERLASAMTVDLQSGRFITMVLAVLDHVTHVVEFANAGHAPALFYDASGNKFRSLDSTGLPLGVLEKPDYPEGPSFRMQPGDIIVLATDGIVESMDARDQQFGQERLKKLIYQLREAPVEEIVHRVGADVEAHYAGDHPPDDLTILVVRRRI